MLRLIGLLVLLSGAFGMGYVVGQRPVGSFEEIIRELPRMFLESALGNEEALRRRQGLIDAKARIVEAKSNLVNRNGREAARELRGALDSLEAAVPGDRGRVPQRQLLDVTLKIRELRLDLAAGKKIPISRVDDIQRDLDSLLER